jgi:hypothetical protein
MGFMLKLSVSYCKVAKLGYYSGKCGTSTILPGLLPGGRIRRPIIDDRFNGRKLFDKITGSRYVHIRTIATGLVNKGIFTSPGVDDK